VGGKKSKPRHIDSSQVARAVFATAESMVLADKRSVITDLHRVYQHCPEVMRFAHWLAQHLTVNAKLAGAWD